MIHDDDSPKEESKPSCKVLFNSCYWKIYSLSKEKKIGNVRNYNEEAHSRLLVGHDWLTDSQSVEAATWILYSWDQRFERIY